MKDLQHTDYEMFLVASPDEKATNASRAVDNDRARVALGGEGARLVVKEKDGPLLGESEVVFVVVIVVDTDESEVIIGTANSQWCLRTMRQGLLFWSSMGGLCISLAGMVPWGFRRRSTGYSKQVGLVGLGLIIRVKS